MNKAAELLLLAEVAVEAHRIQLGLLKESLPGHAEETGWNLDAARSSSLDGMKKGEELAGRCALGREWPTKGEAEAPSGVEMVSWVKHRRLMEL
jgi:hypothetical protein